MSNENNTESGGVGGLLKTLKSNPKAMYAAVGALAVVVLVLMMGGDDGVEQVKSGAISPGQTVTVRNPNVGDTWLTVVPKMGSEDTGEEKDQYICLVKGGATATVDEEAVITYIPYVKVTVKSGECQGKSGWTPKVNVAAK